MTAAPQRSRLGDAGTRLRRAVRPDDPSLRVLAVATLVNTTGNGAFYTVSALYFTRVVGLRPAQLGLALTLAGLVRLAVGLPAGHLGDRYGPREVLRVLLLALTVLTLVYAAATTFWQVVVVAALIGVADAGSNAVRNGLTATLSARSGDRVRMRAYLRAVVNVGISVGALLGGLALAFDTRWAYVAVFVLNAVSYLGTAAVLGRLPKVERTPSTRREAVMVLRDRPFVTVIALNAVFALHFGLVDIGVPLWISARTHAPTWMVSVLLLVNTVTVVVLQVRVARGTDTVPLAARAFGRAGLFTAAACVVYSFAAGVPAWAAVVVLVVGALLQVMGEMVGSAGQWGISMGLAPAERQGQYQGFASTGFAASNMLAPVVLTLLCVEWGRPGWWLLGALLLGAALLQRPVSAWALRTRARYGVTSASG